MTHLVILALGHKMHGAIDWLLLILRDGHEVVEVPLKDRVKILENEDIRVYIDDIVHLPAFRDQLLQERIPSRPMVQIIVRIPAEKRQNKFLKFNCYS